METRRFGKGMRPLLIVLFVICAAGVVDAQARKIQLPEGVAVYEIVKASGVPAKYHVAEGITHFQIYREKFEEATAAAIEWFDEHLAGAGEAKAAAGG
jgi:hypothetical protein